MNLLKESLVFRFFYAVYSAVGDAISGFLRELPALYADVFIRRYYHLCSIRQVAEEFSISESKTKSVLFRMRKELKKYLEKEGLF